MKALHSSAAIETIYARILRQGLQQFCICSTQHQAGNSAISLAIARRAAESGKRVLLIEMNRTTPSLSELQQQTASEWLPLTGHWEHAAQNTEQPGLMLLCSPEKSSHCVEFRDQETLRLFFTSCLQQFDLVICDTEPLLSKSGKHGTASDGVGLPVDVVCAASETILLNIVTGKTTESEVEEAREILLHSGANLKGVIMNDRYAPGLKQELIRETYRFQKIMPRGMAWIRQRLDKMELLNQEL